MLCSVTSVMHLGFMTLKNKNMLSLVLLLYCLESDYMEVNFIFSGLLVCDMYVLSFRGYFNASYKFSYVI